jgi:hypothetical protein
MRAGFNPTRRNRNIGTAKQGHGRDNRMVVPKVATRGRNWSEELNPHQLAQRVVSGRELTFIVEELRLPCVHACTIEDICRILANIPLSDWAGLDTFVLRQSTRKQWLLHPAWGRMFYWADLGLPDRRATTLGPAVILEAVDCSEKFEWPTALDPDDVAELERLRSDGHRVSRVGRRYVFSMTLEAVRATQLYRTMLHEIGHWLDYLDKVKRPTDLGTGDHTQLSAAYFQRPRQEREAFAHRYATTTRERLVKFGILPFDPLSDVQALGSDLAEDCG